METKTNPRETVVMFNSVGEACRYACEGRYKSEFDSSKSWTGAASRQEAMTYVMRGASAAECKPAHDLIDKIDAGIHGRKRSEWNPSVCGAYPMVPDFLAGMPENMRARQMVEAEVTPLRLYVDITVSSGLAFSELRKRGAACAALAMALTEVRPVELYAVAGNMVQPRSRMVLTCTLLDTKPANVPQIVAVIAQPQFFRSIIFSVYANVEKTNHVGSLPFGWGMQPCQRYMDEMRRALAMEPQDVFIPGGYLSEAGEMMRDPLAWVEKYLAAQREVD